MTTSHTVLIVDSFPVSRESCRASLEDPRWDLMATGTCEDALAILGREQVDAVVCYAHLEFPDGTNLITAVRDAAGPQLPIFALVDRAIAVDGTPHGPDGLVIEVRDPSHIKRVLCNLFRDTSTPPDPLPAVETPVPSPGTGGRRRLAAVNSAGVLVRHAHALLGRAREVAQRSTLLRRLRGGSASARADEHDVRRRR